jgi:hypothetical protein
MQRAPTAEPNDVAPAALERKGEREREREREKMKKK